MSINLRSVTRVCSCIAMLLVFGCSSTLPQTRQEHIHHMGQGVMPFSLEKTVHIFRMTETGGVQRVIVKDPSTTDQISLIQQHLQHEAMRFQSGDFSDPVSLHGENMPGLKELSSDAARIRVTYTDLPTGGEILFETSDIHLLTAIHRWFGAQLSEHGADAVAE